MQVKKEYKAKYRCVNEWNFITKHNQLAQKESKPVNTTLWDRTNT